MMPRIACILAVFALACDPTPTGDPDAGAPPPPDPGLLDPILPFELAGTINYNSAFSEQSLEQGPFVPATLWFNLWIPDPSRYQETALLAVAAIPDHVVVVFPANSHDGLAIAWGGLDSPWQTQPLLTDLTRPFIGAVDAVMNPAGDGVLVAVRERFYPARIFVLEWKLDGSITREEVPRPRETVTHWWQDRCPDLQLGVSKRGDVDLLFMQDGYTHMRARRPAGTNEWETDVIRESDDFRSDVGCMGRIAYDEADKPVVLSMYREWPVYERDPNFPDPDEPPPWNGLDGFPIGAFGGGAATTIQHYWQGFVKDGVDRWRGDLSAYNPAAMVPYPHYWQLGGADVETHPDGFHLSGVLLDRNGPPHVSLLSKGFQLRDVPRLKTETEWRLQVDDLDDTVMSAFSELAPFGNLDKVTITECGAVVGFGREWALEAQLRVPFTFGFVNGCLHATEAPVFLSDQFLHENSLRAVVHAHGRRSFDVGVCVHVATGRPALCAGGYMERYLGKQAPLQLPGVAPALVSASLVDGAQDVPATTDSVSFQLARPIDASETVSYQVVRVSDGERTEALLPASGLTEVRVPLPTLTPGALYRVALRVSTEAGPWGFLRERPPLVRFRVAGGARAQDPRTTPALSNCEGVRTGDACVIGYPVPFAQGAEFRPSCDYDVEASGGRLPRLYDSANQPVGGVTVEQLRDPLNSPIGIRLKWRTALLPSTEYTLVFSPDSRTSMGTPFLPNDLKIRFTTQTAE